MKEPLLLFTVAQFLREADEKFGSQRISNQSMTLQLKVCFTYTMYHSKNVQYRFKNTGREMLASYPIFLTKGQITII